MSFFADREMIVSGFTIGAVSILVGVILLLTRDARVDQFYAFALSAAGIVLIFASTLARNNPRNTALLRVLLAAFVVFLLIGLLFKDVIGRSF